MSRPSRAMLFSLVPHRAPGWERPNLGGMRVGGKYCLKFQTLKLMAWMSLFSALISFWACDR
jgi:hypothetical protein